MEHINYKELITLYYYNEIDETQKQDLLKHLESCEECKAEFELQNNIFSIYSSKKFPALKEDYLKEARIELRTSLRFERNKSNAWEKIKEGFLGKINFKFAVGFAMAIVLGFVGGYFYFDKVDNPFNQGLIAEESYFDKDTQIGNIRFIDSDISDGEVEFTFEAVKPVRLRGKINDAKIQNVLMYSILNENNTGVKLNSLNLISNTTPDTPDPEVRDALITLAKYDKNPGVRKEALTMLRKYKYDEAIKDVFLHVLKNDEVSGLRVEAINYLAEVSKTTKILNTNDLKVLNEKINTDDNNYVRIQAKNVVEEYK